MKLRQAVQSDLPQLRKVYTAIYQDMRSSGVDLWNEHYPYDEFSGDIASERLWLLCDGNTIAAAFALDKCPEMTDLRWHDQQASADILMRLGVNVEYRHRGLGARCVEYAGELAGKRGAEYLRLLVAECNAPAEEFYRRCGFIRADGIHTEHAPGIPGALLGYGYEIRIATEV